MYALQRYSNDSDEGMILAPYCVELGFSSLDLHALSQAAVSLRNRKSMAT